MLYSKQQQHGRNRCQNELVYEEKNINCKVQLFLTVFQKKN